MNNPNNKLITKEAVENILNYFGNIGDNDTFLHINKLDNYQRAFIHESYHQSVQNYLKSEEITDDYPIYINYISTESYEILEFLGDNILKSCMSKYLVKRFTGEGDREKFLTRLKIQIEQCSMLHKIGITLGFKKYILLSLQVENQTILGPNTGRNTSSFYEDAFEAFIGAIVTDLDDNQERGYLYASRFVKNIMENIIDFAEIIDNNHNFKDSLQRYWQFLKWNVPNYKVLDEGGALCRKLFTVFLILTDSQYNELNNTVQNKIETYTQQIINTYKKTNPELFKKLYELCIGVDANESKCYILGLSSGKKKKEAEQDVAKISLLNLDLSLNY